ncbi:MAG: chromosome segregation protein SMC [Cytophagales bacterium]|nr:chromosome segregation protein SMC [Cytophagales bacterium]
MQLTRLEIKGFKSFADKVVINFDEGITGIVGPNGCGKSNVVDSIRWVLGEQKSRVLRSDKMDNIIFNGTRNRKPTQLAEVSLTFNNTKNLIPTEYSQVTITRRYYRSGESEYLLNNVACRLKDITNLFLDTGIASNSYAIIELKMVDDLLNDKDNSRRALFEEAAGISKFKIRKKETLKKLSDTDDDLARVEDLLFEIEKNLKSLERQARQAKKYYEIKEEYKITSIALAHITIKSLNEIHDNINEQLTNENDKKISLNKQLSEKEALIQQFKTELVSKEKLLASRQKTLNEHVHKIRQYESDKKIRNERQRFLQDKVENLKEQISQDKQSSERASFSIISLENEKETAEAILADITEKLEALKTEYEGQKVRTQEIQQMVNESNQMYNSRREQVFQQSKEIEIKEIQLSTLKQELEKTSEDSSEQSASLQEFESKLAEIDGERQQAQERFESLKQKEENLAENLQLKRTQLSEFKDEEAKINRKLDAAQNEYALTKSLVENLEGFPEAIKFLKKKKEYKATPLLSDILTTGEEYRICIENFLEPFMNHFIVNTHDEAEQAIELLAESTRGKANFFVLDELQKRDWEPQTNIEGATPATAIVEYEDQYKNLIHYLLHHAYVYEEGVEIKKEWEHLTFIAKSGQITRGEYHMSGGSVGLFEGKRIGRAKNLEKLNETIKELTKKQGQVHTKVISEEMHVEDLSGASQGDELEQVRTEMTQLNESYISLKTRQEQFVSMLSSNSLKREDLEHQIQELEGSLIELRPSRDLLEEQLEELEFQSGNQKQEFEAANELLSHKSAAFNEENVLFHRQQNKVDSVNQEISFKGEALNSSQDRIMRNQEELEMAEQDLSELIKRTAVNDDDLISMYEEKETIEGGVNEAEKSYYQLRGNIDTEEKHVREVQRQRETVDQVLMQWQNKMNETKLQLHSAKDRLSVEFNINFDDLEGDIPEGFENETEANLKLTTEKLKNRLDNMGPINPMAMEAYEEIKERYDFITTQKEDLLKAKESLLNTIGEIDQVAKETFTAAFEEIKANFINVFRTLFTEEDDCDLRLADPDNPLESSIEIMAKPKGKRPLTINQLSGGEKTLTATSLLFAIYLIKPAPFCIFDEVDAPLDDANIDKFNNIIRKFSNESQFIIVTHNKRTMASTDVIYGVTMTEAEQGVSKVVPVDLRQLN